MCERWNDRAAGVCVGRLWQAIRMSLRQDGMCQGRLGTTAVLLGREVTEDRNVMSLLSQPLWAKGRTQHYHWDQEAGGNK